MKKTKNKVSYVKVVQPTREEKVASELKRLKQMFISVPPPHRTPKVGDLVRFGGHPNAQVVEVFEDGKYVELKCWGEYKVYSEIVYRETFLFCPWVDFVPLNDLQPENVSLVHNENIRLDYSNMAISSMIFVFYEGGIDMEPDYQRDYVWSEKDNVALIDSIYDNRSIGSHVLVWLPCGFKHHYEVLDGKQRINALISFYEDRFQYKGKYFSELSFYDQKWFENFMFPRAEIKDHREGVVPKEKKIEVFLHVNTCGRVMDEAHLEKVRAMLNN